MGVNNPIGAFHNNHNLGLCYYMLVELDPSHRAAVHNIFLATVGVTDAYHSWPARHLVMGQPDEPGSSSSFGMAMRRLRNGINVSIPDIESPTSYRRITFVGGCMGAIGDYPALGWLLGFKESVGPNVKRMCRLCNCSQEPCADTENADMYPAKTANTFLPDVSGAGQQVNPPFGSHLASLTPQ